MDSQSSDSPVADKSTDKPLVIICLDAPLAQDVANALPEEIYDIRLTQTKSARRGSAEADAYEAQQLVDTYFQRPGFVICDEANASALSGASVTIGAGRKGWHTVLRSGSNKSNLAIAADRYLSGEFSGDKNIEQIVAFIKERTDANGQVIPKDRLPGMLPFEVALQECEDKINASARPENEKISTSDSHMIKGMIRSLVIAMEKGAHPELKKRMDNPAKARPTAQTAVDDMLHYIKEQKFEFRALDADTLEKLASENKQLTDGEELVALYKEDPQAFHERAIEEVRRREIAGDEPPGATEAFIAHIRKEHPDFRLASEIEDAAVSFAIKEAVRKDRMAKKGWARHEGD